MDLPPSSHFIYIPIILILGLAFGFVMGARTTREAIELERRREVERQQRRAARAAAAQGDGNGQGPDPQQGGSP